MGTWTTTIRGRVGCWLHERWQTECALSPLLSRWTGIRWVDLHNRIECLGPGGDPASRVCPWQWTSELTVCRVFPDVARRLCAHCLSLWPLGSGPAADPDPGTEPRISVVIPIGGQARMGALRAVVESFRRQSVTALEIIVLEQSEAPQVQSCLPAGVRYAHVPTSQGAEGFNKSLLLNEGVRRARAAWVLLHDADIVVPQAYLAEVLARAAQGWEAVRPIRLLFYLDADSSSALAARGELAGIPDRVSHNFPGGSTAVRRDVYWEIGGHDEAFVGWGGEDTEFLDRLRTRRLFPGHFAPALHLWHPAAPKKATGDRNQDLLDSRLAVPAVERIRSLQKPTGGTTD